MCLHKLPEDPRSANVGRLLVGKRVVMVEVAGAVHNLMFKVLYN